MDQMVCGLTWQTSLERLCRLHQKSRYCQCNMRRRGVAVPGSFSTSRSSCAAFALELGDDLVEEPYNFIKPPSVEQSRVKVSTGEQARPLGLFERVYGIKPLRSSHLSLQFDVSVLRRPHGHA